MRTAATFEQEFKRLQKRPGIDFSDEVRPVGEILTSLSSESELEAFKTALAHALTSPDERMRHWVRGMCLGFIYCRDAIAPPVFVQRDALEPRSEHSGPTRDARAFADALASLPRKAAGVDDALRLFRGARPGSELKAYLDGVEEILSSGDERLRAFGIDVCIEFVLREVPHAPVAKQGPFDYVVHSREPFRLNPNLTLRARKLVSVHLPRTILSPEGTPLSEIVKLSNQDANVGLMEAKPGAGVAAIIFELHPGDEICLKRSSEAMVDDGTDNGVVVFDAQSV